MEVRDVFALRKEGRTEEAYKAIIPMYKTHQGHYTTLAMFWVANDMLQLTLTEKRNTEAVRIFKALCNVYRKLDDNDGKAQSCMLANALKISEIDDSFSMTDFITNWGMEKLGTADWASSSYENHPVPSIAQRIIGKIFKEIAKNPTLENANRTTPIIREALKHDNKSITFLRLLALIYKISGNTEKAEEIYATLLKKHKLSYLYSEMAQVTNDKGKKIYLYCQAICSQYNETFRTKDRIHLAALLYSDNEKGRAAYEIRKSIANRQASGSNLSREQLTLSKELETTQAVSESSELEFYMQEKKLYTV